MIELSCLPYFLNPCKLFFAWCKFRLFLPLIDLFWRSFGTKRPENGTLIAFMGSILHKDYMCVPSLINKTPHDPFIMPFEETFRWKRSENRKLYEKWPFLTDFTQNYYHKQDKHSFWWLFHPTGGIPGEKQLLPDINSSLPDFHHFAIRIGNGFLFNPTILSFSISCTKS